MDLNDENNKVKSLGCMHWTVQRYLQTVHGDVIKWKHFPRYWPFVRGIHRSPVNSAHKGQWRGAFFFDLRLIKRLSKHSRGWWLETLSRPLWRHCNASAENGDKPRINTCGHMVFWELLLKSNPFITNFSLFANLENIYLETNAIYLWKLATEKFCILGPGGTILP